MKTRTNINTCWICLVVNLLLIDVSLMAATETWDATVNTTWNTIAANWAGPATTFSANDDAIFSSASSKGTLVLGQSINVGSLRSNGANTPATTTITGSAGNVLTFGTGLPGTGGISDSTGSAGYEQNLTYNLSGAGSMLSLAAGSGTAGTPTLWNIASGKTFTVALASGGAATGQGVDFNGNTVNLTGAGTVALQPQGGFGVVKSTGGTATLNVNAGILQLNSGGSTVATFDSSITVNVPSTGILDLKQNSGNGTIYNETVNLNGGTLRTSGNNVPPIQSGPVHLLANSKIDTTGNASSAGMIVAGVISGSANLTKVQVQPLYLAGTNTFTGNLTNSSTSTIVLTNFGQLNSGNYAGNIYVGNAGGALVHSGVITQTLSGVLSGLGGVGQRGTGKFILTGASTYSGATTVTRGTLEVDGIIGSSSGITVSGGVLDGAGIVIAPVTVQAGGTLMAGTDGGMGILSVSNVLTMNSGSTNLMRINKTGSTLSSDLVKGMSSVFFGSGAVLTVTATGDALAAGDTFTLFSASSYNGTPTVFNLPTLVGGLSWDISQLPVNGTIKVASGTGLPIFNPPAGGYGGAQSVTISSDPGATIFYTTDGSDPTTSPTRASGASPISGVVIPVNTTETLKAYATNSGFAASAVATAVYVTVATPTWTNLVGGAWTTSANWLAGVTANGSGITADFTTLTLPSDATVSVGSSITVGSMLFMDVGNSFGWMLNGSGPITMDAGTNKPSIVTSNQTVAIATPIIGTNGILIGGTGVLTLSGANSYTGGLVINTNSTVHASSSSALGGRNNALNIESGTLDIGGQTISLGTLSGDYAANMINSSFNAPTFTIGNPNTDPNVTGSGAGTYSGQIGGGGGGVNFLKESSGTLVLGGNVTIAQMRNNSFVGNGELILAGTSVIGLWLESAYGGVVRSTGNTSFSGGGDNIRIFSTSTTGTLIVDGGTFTSSGHLCLGYGGAGTNKFIINGGYATIQDVAMGNAMNIGGATSVSLNGGTLEVMGGSGGGYFGNYGNTSNSINFNGGILKLDSGTATNGVNPGTNAGGYYIVLNVNAGGAVIETAGSDLYIPVALQSNSVAGGLIKLGAGALILQASNTYAGPTVVSNGVIEITYPTLAEASMVKIESGAALKLDFAITNKVGSLVLNGVSQAPGVYNSTTASPYITGAGSLLVTPPVATNSTNITTSVAGGVLTLSWPADHTGWRLQVQTNSLSTGLNTNWSDVAGSTLVNTLTVHVDNTAGAIFYRMVYP